MDKSKETSLTKHENYARIEAEQWSMKMKKVIKVTDTELVLDDGSVVELLFELDKPLTLEVAQQIYEKSLKLRDSIIAGEDDAPIVK